MNSVTNLWSRLVGKLFPETRGPVAYDAKEAKATSHDATPVRDAGTKAMRDPPKGWSKEDEESDASFPASDPPGNY
jgi:hypothetical protein